MTTRTTGIVAARGRGEPGATIMSPDPLAVALGRIARAVSGALELKDVFTGVAEAAATVLPFDIIAADLPPIAYERTSRLVRVGGRRSWLVLDGLFYEGDVWLDGSYLGATEGYFFPHWFEVTDALPVRRWR